MKGFILTLGLALTLVGCTGKAGPSGPSGSNGSPAANTFQATFQNGVYPSGSYNGEIDTWLDGNNATIAQNATAYRRIKTGSNNLAYGRVLLNFNISSLPVNAQIISAAIDLTTQSTTTISSNSVTIGVHTLSSSLIPNCLWTISATWGFYSGTSDWSACDSDVSAGQQGMMNLTPMSTAVLTSSINGTSKVFEWTLTPSLVQSWLTGTNQGVVLRSEGEFNESVSSVDFYPYNSGSASNNPILIITYQ